MNLNNQYSENSKFFHNNLKIDDNLNQDFDSNKADYLEKNFKWKGVALWLIENTAINFEQIANFCGLHLLQIEALANDEVEENIKPINPITEGIIEKETIDACNKDPEKPLTFSVYNNLLIKLASQKGKFKYTTMTRKKNKPDAIAWLLKIYPFISDSQIIKLIGTTKNTIESIRSKTYKGIKNIKPKSPVALGLCNSEQLEVTIMNAKILHERMQIENNNKTESSYEDQFNENNFDS
jgi:hypothetical protein